MYIMRKMNREKKAATDAGRAALLADGYRDVTPQALHEDTPDKKEDAVMQKTEKKGKVPAGKNPDKARDSKKAQTAGTADYRPLEKDSRVMESTEAADSMQQGNPDAAAVPETQQSEGAAVSAQEQSAKPADSTQQSPEASQNPR